MGWLPQYDQGRTPADYTVGAGMSVHNGGQPIQRRNQWLDAIAHIAPQVMAYIKQKKQDEIANSLMNMEQPPRAEAVDPSLQGAPATKPFTGGAEGFKVHQMYQDYLNHQQDRQWKQEDRQYEMQNRQPDTATDDLNYQKLWNEVHKPTGPMINIGGQEYPVTPDAALRHQDSRLANPAGLSAYGVSQGALANVDTETPNVVQYQDEAGQKISTEEANMLGGLTAEERAKAGLHGKHAYAVAPGLPRVPYDKWNAAVSLYKQAQQKAQPQPKVMGQQTDAVKAPTLSKTPVQVSTPAEANALPPGTYYVDPQGKLHQR